MKTEYKLNILDFKTAECRGGKDFSNLGDSYDPAGVSHEPEVFTFSYEDNGKDKPVIKANGKEVSPETLFSDPDVKYLAQLLEILD